MISESPACLNCP